MLQRYVDPGAANDNMQAMELEELIGYLRNANDTDITPMQSILAQTDAIGDPALPTDEQMAILHWLGVAFDDWEQSFPLEQPLCTQLRRLKPLIASLAIVDPDFLTPGGHPMHRVLDNLQAAAVGWQSRLGRTGQALESLLTSAVEEALVWFNSPEADLSALCARVSATTERDLARANRMAQRMVETEQGKIKNAMAKREAANMINTALQQLRAPPSIGAFLTGPWYDSAKLVLLKFGAESEQWAQMSATTATLLDSVQPAEAEEEPGRRQHLFEIVTRLPRELKRWLLSLQHDSEAANNAMGMVEYAHMQILRKKSLELEHTELIPIATLPARTEAAQNTLQSIATGQWFSMALKDGETVRARLALRIEESGELLFADQAGIKILQQSFEEFAGLLDDGKISPLDSGASFSRCLARAAGIEDTADLDSLLSATVLQARREAEEQRHLEQALRQQEQEQAEQLARQQEAAEQLQQEQAQEQEQAAHRELGRAEAEKLAIDQLEAEKLQQEWDEAKRRQQQRIGAEPAAQTPGRRTPPIAATTQAPVDTSGKDERVVASHGSTLAAQANDVKAIAQIDLPMGAWLGFHDGDTPLLAKLAVHDRENDHYIFVNRSGIKMRQFSGQELWLLMEKGLVDVLEARSNFRDEIARTKKQSED